MCGFNFIHPATRFPVTIEGSELDLAGLVCNKLGDHQCINPMKGKDGGDTWVKRLEDLEKMGNELQDE